MDRGAWQAVVHGVAKSWTRLQDIYHTSKILTSNQALVPLLNFPGPQFLHTKSKGVGLTIFQKGFLELWSPQMQHPRTILSIMV